MTSPLPVAGTEMPVDVTDLRDPDPTLLKGRWRKSPGSPQLKLPPGKYFQKPARTHVCLTKTGAIIFYYGDHNTVDWRSVLAALGQGLDKTLQDDYFDIVVYHNGYIINRTKETGGWGGDRTRYSLDVAATVRALLDRNLATSSTPIWIGSWSAYEGEYIGSVGSILRMEQKPIPSRLVLYHGTSNYRYELIMKYGLQAIESDNRVWNSARQNRAQPEHRDNSVYLTASMPQAQYYSQKATNVDRARRGRNWRPWREKLNRLEVLASNASWNLDRHPEPEQRIALQARLDDLRPKIDALKEKLNFYSKFKPVILRIVLTPSDYKHLKADDDYLRHDTTRKTEDWRDSLSHFGQVAYTGTIPPNRITEVPITKVRYR